VGEQSNSDLKGRFLGTGWDGAGSLDWPFILLDQLLSPNEVGELKIYYNKVLESKLPLPSCRKTILSQLCCWPKRFLF